MLCPSGFIFFQITFIKADGAQPSSYDYARAAIRPTASCDDRGWAPGGAAALGMPARFAGRDAVHIP